MKNLLVEAARVSSLTETSKNLLDSGSFDTTSQTFEDTANDPTSLDGSPGDAAVRPEGSPLELEDIQPEWEALEDGAVDVDYAVDATPSELQAVLKEPVPQKSSAIVRLSPYLCVVSALVSSIGWMFYLDVATNNSTTTLGAAILQTPRDAMFVEEVPLSNADRFPFIDVEDGDVGKVEQQ